MSEVNIFDPIWKHLFCDLCKIVRGTYKHHVIKFSDDDPIIILILKEMIENDKRNDRDDSYWEGKIF